MSSAFGDLTGQAHQLVSAGDLAGAQQLLSDALSDADPHPDSASPEVADAAGLQARVLVALGEPHSARGWAAFAYAATSRLHGPSDPRTVAAAATLAAVLHRVGSHARAARLYSDVVIELTASDGPESLRVLAAHADLATVEYARGQCEVARDRLQDAWELHREVYGDGHPSGIKMLARLGSMQRDCGEFAEAHDNLALARDLCRQHLAVDDPLAVQVAALARAAANPDHVCSRPAPAREREAPKEPVVPAARVAPAAEGPPTHQPTWPPDDAPPTYQSAWPPDEGPPTHQPTWPPDDAPPTYQPAWPPDEGPPPPVVPAPRFPADDAAPLAEPGDPAYAGGDRDRWPPEDSAPWADGEHRERAADEPPPGVRPVRVPAVRPDPSRLLPVVVPRPPEPPQRRLTPLLVLGGVTVVVLGAAAVIAGVARVDGSGPEPAPAPSATASPSAGPKAAASPGAPPGGVRLSDDRERIALRWTYPAGANGPVVITGARSGQQPRPLATLPPGSTSWSVEELDRTGDYCFTVAVVWSADHVGRSREVCTRRR
ncbi:tetratricopeptide repeat protein [Micromonospora okii]|uniref:tetratricopeptide repeat protein n=1 Tax=Micromonospora okii TaxID=1182970 RepID=UPI001E44FD72|nr:tetratricopeptide repeat protein [Micromonospora okii]